MSHPIRSVGRIFYFILFYLFFKEKKSLYNFSNRERIITADLSPALIGCQQRVSSCTILLSPEGGRGFSHREESLLTAEITPRPLTSVQHTDCFFHPPGVAVCCSDPAGALRVLHGPVDVHRQTCFDGLCLC